MEFLQVVAPLVALVAFVSLIVWVALRGKKGSGIGGARRPGGGRSNTGPGDTGRKDETPR